MGQCLVYWQALDGACLPCSLHGQIFNMAGFGMRERGFNTIISRMIVSHYSAAASSTGMRGGCLLSGGRDVCCCSCDVVDVDLLTILSLLLLLFVVTEYEEWWLISVFVVGLIYKLRDQEEKPHVFLYMCAAPVCVCVYKQHARVSVVTVPVCWNSSWWRDALFMSLPVISCGFSSSTLTLCLNARNCCQKICGFK